MAHKPHTHERLSKDSPILFRRREAAEHAKQELHFKEIEQSQKHAAEVLVSSQLEIERSRRIMKAADEHLTDLGDCELAP
jgi:hypothetical protein